MAKIVKTKKATKSDSKEGLVYLTTRILERAVAKGTKSKKADAIRIKGYTVVEKNGWVVKEYADGRIEQVSKIKKAKRSQTLVLD